jgi:predicted RNase H-like HicB family nuclease
VSEADGGYCAEFPTESIFAQTDSWHELRRNIREAVNAFDEVLSVA